MHRRVALACLCLSTLACDGFHMPTRPQRESTALGAHWIWDKNDLPTDLPMHPTHQRLLVPALSLLLSAALAFPALAFDASIYTNDYGDPFHPLCKRRIEVSTDGGSFRYSGTAVGPKDDPVRRGCSAEEIEKYTLRQGAFDGLILDNGKISAGDGIHEGVWEPAGTATTTLGYEDVDGIRWNDGNKWFVLKSSEEPTQS
jgi:hypothetical protein